MTLATRRDQPLARLHIVSGKGGTGKTTVAAALALALASEGKKVLVCEVEGRQGLASLFDVAPLPYAERRVAVGPDNGGEVHALAIDTEAALLEYLDMFYRLGRAGKALDRFGVIDFATTVAPGVRDVLLIGKVFEATQRQAAGRPAYDAVVLDAPPTGRIGKFLNVNTEVAGIAKVGPIRKQATSIMRLLTSPQAHVHLVTSLEEMPVQETLDAIDELARLGLRLGSVIVNRMRTPELPAQALADAARGRLDEGRIEASLKEAGIKADASVIAGLLDAGQQHAERVALEVEQRRRLDDLGSAVVTLPYLADGVDLGDLYELAADLRASGEF
ncbi:MAG: ArsA family ATPase [Nocardioidaceae bacterium]|nr:ArsA family ATPase [Nocardioidaceae bacterium]